MAVTKWSDESRGLSRYIEPQDVRDHLVGVAADDAGNPFEALFSGRQVNQMFESFLPIVADEIDSLVGHDFGNHEEVEIEVDGKGSHSVQLARWGFVPLLDLHSITVDSVTESVDDFKIYEHGILTRKDTNDDGITLVVRTFYTFPLGRRNVVLEISWGYATVPAKVKRASALLTASMMLENADLVQDRRAPGVFGDMGVVYGDVKFFAPRTPRYASAATRMRERAENLLQDFVYPAVTAPTPGIDFDEAQRLRAHYLRYQV